MLHSHSPSRVGANPLKSQPGIRKRPEAGTMGEGGKQAPLGRQTWPTPQARARGPQSRSSAGLRRSRNSSEHKAPSRPASGSALCPLLPSPSRAAQPETVPGRGRQGRQGGVLHPARFSDLCALATRPWRPALCCPPQLRRPSATRAEVLCASPIQPGASFFAYSRAPLPACAAQTPEPGTRS